MGNRISEYNTLSVLNSRTINSLTTRFPQRYLYLSSRWEAYIHSHIFFFSSCTPIHPHMHKQNPCIYICIHQSYWNEKELWCRTRRGLKNANPSTAQLWERSARSARSTSGTENAKTCLDGSSEPRDAPSHPSAAHENELPTSPRVKPWPLSWACATPQDSPDITTTPGYPTITFFVIEVQTYLNTPGWDGWMPSVLMPALSWTLTPKAKQIKKESAN